MQKKSLFALAVVSTILTSPSFAGDSLCENFAQNMTKNAVAIFHNSKQSENEKRKQLSTLFQEAVDTDWIGKFVLGRFWKSASADEQKQYLDVYRPYITNSYVSKFNDEEAMSVSDIKIASLTPQQEDGQFEAKTLVQRSSEEDVHVDYLLDQSSGKCQVHDIKVEGVSLIASQRSEFGALAGNSGVKGVIAAIKKQLEKPIAHGN
jgi:phospholipid transport system substrate-binding protein